MGGSEKDLADGTQLYRAWKPVERGTARVCYRRAQEARPWCTGKLEGEGGVGKRISGLSVPSSNEIQENAFKRMIVMVPRYNVGRKTILVRTA